MVSSYARSAPRPKIGTRWTWGNGEPCSVVEVTWNGEEWWVLTDGPWYGRCWNDVAAFWQAVRFRS